jgi:chromosome segregation protein
MTQLLQETLAADEALTGIVGSRRLVCVQTIDIARLTPNPVPLVPGFVGVTGRGPRNDSNESGKTNFLAAVSLLLGDPEWRMHSSSGPQAATGLLFDPVTAGAERYAPAHHGYVLGIFAYSESDPRPLTVWCRINDGPPYMKVRWQEGVVLAGGKNSEERHRISDELWASLPKSSELGAHTYAEELYGPSPRALAYVSDRGSRHSGPSLLKMQAGQFKPHEIGEQLIALTGRAGVFEQEQRLRADLDERLRELEKRRGDDRTKHEREEGELEWVRRRQRAREQVTVAADSWELHFARGLLDRLEEKDKLDAQASELEEALAEASAEVREATDKLQRLARPDDLRRQLTEATDSERALQSDRDAAAQTETEVRLALEQLDVRNRDLEAIADGWSGASSAACAEQVRGAESAVEQAQQQVGIARNGYDEARRMLDAAREGRSTEAAEALAALAEGGVGAQLLYDSVEVDGDAREQWEPRLEPFRQAIVVPPDERANALELAGRFPGAMLVCGREASLPNGIRSAPEGANALLEGLAKRSSPIREGVEDAELGLTIVGGFASPQVGRAARVAAAEKALSLAGGSQEVAGRALVDARGELELAKADHARAEAAEQLALLPDKRRRHEERLDEARRLLAEIEPQLGEARDLRAELSAQLNNLEELREAAERRLEDTREGERGQRKRLHDVNEALGRLGLEYWQSGWGRSVNEARAALQGDPRSLKRLRNLAAEAINSALHALETDASGEGAPTEELAIAARSRRAFVESEDEEPTGGQLKLFDAMFEPLQAYLEQYAARDTIAEEKILSLREQREREVELAAYECARLTNDLSTVQDALEHRLELALRRISDEFDRLNIDADGHGAELDVRPLRPQTATDLWRWEVTPRWRRSRGGRMLPYTNRTNTAQEKLATVHLVLAALLAAPNPAGRVLILDELGDSLGENHRREAIRAMAETAEKSGVSVLATCQDSVLEDAMEVADELLFFEYPRHDEAYNRPTRMFGFTSERETVELTAEAISEGRRWW